MKKLTLTIAATIALSMGAFGQGYLVLSSPGDGSGPNTVTTNVNSGTGWYTGNLTLEVYYAAASTVATNDARAIDTAGSSTAALALLAADSGVFSLESLGAASPSNSIYAPTSDGGFGIGTVQINGNGIAAGGNGVFVLVGIAGNLEGLVAFANQTGNTAPGAPAALGWDNEPYGATTGFAQLTPMNMYLTPVPEPASLALAGLGGLSMLLFRRRNK